VRLNTYLNDVVTEDHVNEVLSNVPTLSINTANINYTNEDNVVKTVQVRLFEIDTELKDDNEFDQSEIIKQISDITGNVNDRIENIADMAKKIKNIATISATASGVAGTTEAAPLTATALGGEFGGEIALAACVAAGAVGSIITLTAAIADLEIPKLPISATQVNFTKTDENTVQLYTYLKDIASDIQATSDHLSQSALTIEKINEINPLLPINEYYNSSPPKKKRKTLSIL
jgi:hypothetical protein